MRTSQLNQLFENKSAKSSVLEQVNKINCLGISKLNQVFGTSHLNQLLKTSPLINCLGSNLTNQMFGNNSIESIVWNKSTKSIAGKQVN